MDHAKNDKMKGVKNPPHAEAAIQQARGFWFKAGVALADRYSMASDFEDLPSSTSDSSFASAGIRQDEEVVLDTAKKNANGAACSNNGASSCRDIHVEALTLLEDSASRIEEDWQWYETLGLSWGRVLNEDKGNGNNPTVGAVLAFNVKMSQIAPAHERTLTPALEALKEVLVAVHNVSNAVRDQVVELVEYCVGVTRGALEAARREEMPRAIAQALGNITAEIEWVEKFTRTYRTVRTGCCRRATLSERDHRRAVAHREKLQDLLNLVLAALAAQSNWDRNKLVRMLNDSAGVGDESGSGLGSGSGLKTPPNGAAEAKELADVPREAPVLPQMYVESLAAVERVVLDLIDPARGALSAHCLVGPEGSGKTLLASEVVRDRRVRSSFRDGIFWFTAGRDSKAADAALFLERVARDFACAASRGTMSAGPHHPQPHPHRLSYRRFNSSENGGNLRCLVVLDDAWDAKVVQAFASAGFHALVTTRRREVIPCVSGGLCSELMKMQRGEAVELLRRASGALNPLPEVEAVQVAEHCAMLPLALNVVGSLARDDPLEATTWQRLHDELLAKRIELLESEPECAAHVFAVVCAGLCHLSEAQKGQFLLLAVLSPGAIATTDMLANLWDTEVGDVRACADLLVDRGLLQAVPEGYRLDGTVLDYLRRTIQLTATHIGDADCPPPTPSELASARQARYLSRPELLHGQHSSVDLCSLVGLWRAVKRVASLGGEVIMVERCYAESLGVLGVEEELPCWRAAGRVVGLLAEYEGAERMLEKALAISEEREEGEDDLEDVATALKDLGRALESQGQLENANRVYARAIEVGERNLPLSAHQGLDRLNSFHYPSHPLDEWSPVPPRDHQGMYEGAVLLYQRAIKTGERVLGPDHPDLASRLNNLAELLRDQGKYDEAEPLYERSQAIRERALGPDDPVVATSLNNRAELLRARGEYARAEPLTMRAQAILEKSEGLHHPDVAITVTNRATLLEAQGKYVDAAPLRLRAIQIWEKIHGPDHELVATALGGQAGVLRHQGKYADAEVLYKRAVKIWTHICGPDHPRVATALNNRAAVLKAQGKYSEADPLYVRSIKIGEETLGAGHPTVATRLGNRARLLAAQGKHDEAVVLLERAVSIRRNALGDYHKGTITFRRALESVRREQISASE